MSCRLLPDKHPLDVGKDADTLRGLQLKAIAIRRFILDLGARRKIRLHYGAIMDRHPGVLKDTIVWNIEAGRKLSAAQLARAEKLRTALFIRMHRFMEKYDFLVMPVNQVPPFDIAQPFVDEIAGVKMENYIDWMRSCYYITATTHPALSVPAGFPGDGLPVGMQIVGRHQGELALLQMGYGFEQATRVGMRNPSCV